MTAASKEAAAFKLKEMKINSAVSKILESTGLIFLLIISSIIVYPIIGITEGIYFIRRKIRGG